jgi:hypothetical protein
MPEPIVADIQKLFATKFDIDADSHCWNWNAGVSSNGYGIFNWKQKQWRSHRFMYWLTYGFVPSRADTKEVIDHICNNRKCCNPAHLRVLTDRENIARSPDWLGHKTHCPRGHEYTPDNTYTSSTGKWIGRQCKTCVKARANKYHELKRSK